MASQAARGKQALDNKDYETAVKEYSAAIKESPTSPEYFIQRATAFTRLQKHAEALEDAEQGVLNAQTRAKKESIIEAQFRRGVALYQLGRYADARYIFGMVKQQQPAHKQVDIWSKKADLALEKLPQDDERRQCNIEYTPAPRSDKTPMDTDSQSSTQATPSSASTQTPLEKIRHEWYQNTECIYFTVFAKGVPKDEATIQVTERSLHISFPTISGSIYELTIDPLFAPVIPEKGIIRVMAVKIEVILIKANVGEKWTSIDSKDAVMNDAPTASPGSNVATLPVHSNPVPVPAPVAASTGPAYPTSSKTGPKDWDKVAKDLGTKLDGSGKPVDGDDEDMEGGDEANAFFKKLFKGASPDMQRAMMKSYTESNGTALSTNWEEVSKGKVETSPPDGMEAKAWEK